MVPAAIVAASCRMPDQFSMISRSLTLPPIRVLSSSGHAAGSST